MAPSFTLAPSRFVFTGIQLSPTDIESDDDQRWLERIRELGMLIDGPTTLWTIREYLLPQARSLIRTGDKSLVDRLMMEGLPK